MLFDTHCVCVIMVQVKDKEAELKSAEQKLHDEFERLRRQNAEEKRQLDDKKRQLVGPVFLRLSPATPSHSHIHSPSNNNNVFQDHVYTCRMRRSVYSTRRRQRSRLSGPRPRRSSWLTNNVVATGNKRESPLVPQPLLGLPIIRFFSY